MKRSRNVASDRRRRKMTMALWLAVLSVITIVLIYKEMTALLYILATFGITALLVVVGWSDLAHSEKITGDPRGSGDSAAIGSGITSTMGNRPQ